MAPDDDVQDLEQAVISVQVHRPGQVAASDQVAVEAPLTVRSGGRPWLTLMRSPGHERALIAGLLRAEAIVQRADELLAVQACSQLDDPDHEGHVYDLRLAPEAAARMAERRRASVSVSSCGVCGKEQIERCLTQFPPVAPFFPRVPAGWVANLPDVMRRFQLCFEQTGAVHAAGIFLPGSRTPLVVREDVGRHNAVDKVLGHCFWLSNDEHCARGAWLVVSGRVSFEIVQKAAMHAVAGIVAVSAPTSLAIELATQANLVLIGFTRKGGFVCYSGHRHVELPSSL